MYRTLAQRRHFSVHRAVDEARNVTTSGMSYGKTLIPLALALSLAALLPSDLTVADVLSGNTKHQPTVTAAHVGAVSEAGTSDAHSAAADPAADVSKSRRVQ